MSKVMIVDDDRTTTSLMQMLLELDGFEVTVVARGVDVIPMAEKVQPELILTDYHLNDIHGVEVVKQIRAHATLKHLPIVVASGMDVSTEVLAAGANEFIVKPFEPDALTPLFHRLLGK
ncbi:MAG: response regulator [Anaerolineae bacterium]|jgi:CheY-like chemotaxis protein|nr:response regulator [Anaerolineae bacterium]